MHGFLWRAKDVRNYDYPKSYTLSKKRQNALSLKHTLIVYEPGRSFNENILTLGCERINCNAFSGNFLDIFSMSRWRFKSEKSCVVKLAHTGFLKSHTQWFHLTSCSVRDETLHRVWGFSYTYIMYTRTFWSEIFKHVCQ